METNELSRKTEREYYEEYITGELSVKEFVDIFSEFVYEKIKGTSPKKSIDIFLEYFGNLGKTEGILLEKIAHMLLRAYVIAIPKAFESLDYEFGVLRTETYKTLSGRLYGYFSLNMDKLGKFDERIRSLGAYINNSVLRDTKGDVTRYVDSIFGDTLYTLFLYAVKFGDEKCIKYMYITELCRTTSIRHYTNAAKKVADSILAKKAVIFRNELKILELDKTKPCNLDEDLIKSQYRKLSLKYHPDRGGDTEMFIKLKDSYNRIKNEF